MTSKIKIFDVSTGRDKTISPNEFSKRARRSTQWFRDTLNTNLTSKNVSKASRAAFDGVDGTTDRKRPSRQQANNKKADQLLNSGSFQRELKKQGKVIKAGNAQPGRLYSYLYLPKHKDTLPYYDIFPLIFMTDLYADGWLGLNMHYLNPLNRANLFSALLRHNVKSKNEREYLSISYGLLKAASANRYMKPCVKRYLVEHTKTPLLEIPFNLWEEAIFLVQPQFRKANKSEVWSDSKAELR